MEKEKTLKEKASYAVGVSIAQNLKDQDLGDIDIQSFSQGFTDFNMQNGFAISQQDMQTSIQQFLDEQRMKAHEQNKNVGEEFLSKNKLKKGVFETDSGLQYEIINEGTGKKPGPQDKVTVHYHGTLTDGVVFDSSVQRGSPASFGVNQVIKGWTEALQLMSEGSKYKLYIPQELAYGANPHPGGPIKPFSALIFEVELLKIEN